MNHPGLLDRFHLDISYQVVDHKKVTSSYDVCMAVPYGPKCALWFTYYRDRHVCVLVMVDKKQMPISYEILDNLSFHTHKMSENFSTRLHFGTMLWGSYTTSVPRQNSQTTPGVSRPLSLVVEDRRSSDQTSPVAKLPTKLVVEDLRSSYNKVFVMEDMVEFCGIKMKQQTFGDKLDLLRQLVDHVTISSLTIRIPKAWMVNDVSENNVVGVPYKVHHHQYRSLRTHAIALLVPMRMEEEKINMKKQKIQRDSPSTKTFLVKADIQYDIYHLYLPDNSYHGVAYIPNYVTSVMMNRLFRKMKENLHLDAIEESDDEEEYANTAEDKYVDLNKALYMECVMHPKFKKWVPIKEK